MWRNLKISLRLAIGVGLILAMLLVVAGAAYIGLSGGNAAFTDYRSLARQTASAGVISGDLMVARFSLKDFLLKGSDDSIAGVRSAVASMSSNIEKSLELFDTPEERQALTDASKRIAEYKAAFEQVVELNKRHNELAAKMNDLGPKIEQQLDSIMDDANRTGDSEASFAAAEALRSFLLARVERSKFLMDNSQELVDKTRANFADFDEIAARLLARLQSADSRGMAEDTLKQAKEYAAAFEGIQAAIFARNDIVNNTLNKIGPAIASDMDHLADSNKAAQDELGPRASAEMEESELVAMIVSILAILTGIAVGFVVARGITKPISAMTQAMGVLANGDKTMEIPAQGRKDEIGAMAAAVQVFKDNMIEADRLRAEQQAEQEKQIERGRKIESAVTTFDKVISEVVDSVSSAATELQATAQSLSATAEETSQQSTAVAAAAEQMSQNVQTVASATEELSSSIREIGSQVTESNRIVGTAVSQADDTNAKVKTLAEAAQRIGDVVTLINEIAAQTNLLALNATIEAARAGEAGKGFAVVASEVKNLATQTAKATEEIDGQVRAIQEATGTSAQAIDSIAQTINRVNEISTVIAAAVEEQGAATLEISRNVQQASSGTMEVSSNITGVTQASQQTSAGSTQVLSAASELARNGARLRQEVNTFLQTVRTA